jgi:hypothetical protein
VTARSGPKAARRSGIGRRRAEALLTGKKAVRPSLVVPAVTSTFALLLCLVSGGSTLLLLYRILRPLRIGRGSCRGGGRRRPARPRARPPACPLSGVEEVAGVEGVREPERDEAIGLNIPQECASGGLAAFCSYLCGNRWSRYSGSSISRTRLRHGLQRLLETV